MSAESKRLRVVGTKRPDGKIDCRIYRIVGDEPPLDCGEMVLDMVQWHKFKQEAEWRNRLDDRSLIYEFELGGDDGQPGQEGVAFNDRVEWELKNK